MPITTAGAAADVTGTFTNNNATANGKGGGTITVFTTPNTANAIFIVNYSIVIGTAAESNLSEARIGLPGISGVAISGSPAAAQEYGLTISSSPGTLDNVSQGTIKMGPNTALAFPVQCTNAASASAATFSYRIRYDYLSVVIS
jgi:hypothetical protein